MSLQKELRLIEEELTGLLEKMAEIRQRVESLETQNAKLLERVNEADLHSEFDEAFKKLYDEGYHICPTHFAKIREGEECLLCMAFMQSQQDGKL